MITVNQKVRTPIGEGVIQGFFAVLDGNNEKAAVGVAVRLPVNDLTRAELHKENCLTPMAVFSGVWVFPEKDLR